VPSAAHSGVGLAHSGGLDRPVGVGGRTGCGARVREQVGRPPQEPDAGAFHVPERPVHQRVESRTGLGEGVLFRRPATIRSASYQRYDGGSSQSGPA